LGIAIEHDEIFLTDFDSNRVIVFSKEGHFLRQWSDGYGSTLSGIAISNDLVYVIDSRRQRVEVFTLSGDYVFEVNISKPSLRHVLVLDNYAYVTNSEFEVHLLELD